MDHLPTTRRKQIATRIRDAVLRHFAHWEAVQGVDFDAAFASYLDEAMTGDRRGFDMASLRFVASLENGHTAFDDAWLWSEHGACLGFDALPMPEGWFVTASAYPDLLVGMRILSVDGMDIECFAAEKIVFIAGSSPAARKRRLFSRPFLFPAAFELGLDDGNARRIERGKALVERPSLAPTSRRIDPGRIHYLRLPSFGESVFEKAAILVVRALPEHVHLVVDIRGNAGGDTPLALIAALMPVPYRFWKVRLAQNEARPPSSLVEAEWVAPLPEAFAGPLTILIDAGTFSAAEDFALPFKDNKRARIVGSTSGGSSGQPVIENLGDGMRLWVGSKRQYMPDGAPFEGHGIEPDVEISTRAADLFGGTDPALRIALGL